MVIQENDMQQIPGNIVKMVSYEEFCLFIATAKVKRAIELFYEKSEKANRMKNSAYRTTSSAWLYNTYRGGKVMDSYYLRIKDLNKVSYVSREYVNTPVYHVIHTEDPDVLNYNSEYLWRKEIETLANKCDNGVIYMFDKCVGRVRAPQTEKKRYDIVIRRGTDAIADSALADSFLVVSVTLPDSVTVIGTGAFEGSRLLETVRLSQNLKYIKDAAFRFCWKLRSIDLPDGLVYIGADAFRKCVSLTHMDIPDSVEFISSKAFFRCFGLKSVRLPAHITKIPLGLFRHCRQLAEIVIPDDVTVIEKYAFANCYNLEKVSLPSGLKRIEDGAFESCPKLKFLEIPDSVEYIGKDLFGKTKRYSTIIASPDNAYVRNYTAAENIKFKYNCDGKDAP